MKCHPTDRRISSHRWSDTYHVRNVEVGKRVPFPKTFYYRRCTKCNTRAVFSTPYEMYEERDTLQGRLISTL